MGAGRAGSSGHPAGPPELGGATGSGHAAGPVGFVRPAGPGGPASFPRPASPGLGRSGALDGPGALGDPAGLPLPLLPGFREMAIRRMSAERRRLVGELAGQRRAAGLSQTEVAARMGTSQSAVARLEAGEADVRASTLERYAAAVGRQISWRLQGGLHAEEESR